MCSGMNCNIPYPPPKKSYVQILTPRIYVTNVIKEGEEFILDGPKRNQIYFHKRQSSDTKEETAMCPPKQRVAGCAASPGMPPEAG